MCFTLYALRPTFMKSTPDSAQMLEHAGTPACYALPVVPLIFCNVEVEKPNLPNGSYKSTLIQNNFLHS
jgi:hypothetical protein